MGKPGFILRSIVPGTVASLLFDGPWHCSHLVDCHGLFNTKRLRPGQFHQLILYNQLRPGKADVVSQLIHDAGLGGSQSCGQELSHKKMLNTLLHCEDVVSNSGDVVRVPRLVDTK